jgi:NAD(P)H dehydrogenase (quinone)
MILITGAGGKTGRSLVRALSKVESVCALVHHQEDVLVLKSLGAEKVIVGDMQDESAIRFALQDVRAIHHICPNMSPHEAAIGKLIIHEAQKAGVEHFVYHSVLHPQTQKMNHHWQKLQVEEMVFESEIPFTILQPAPYMQNLLGSRKSILEDGLLRVPYSVDAKFSFVHLEDISEAAKIILTESNHKNAIYELAGTFPISHREVAEILSRCLNREVRPEKEEIGKWKHRASTALADNAGSAQHEDIYAIENLARMFEYYDQWGLAGNPNVLGWLLKRAPTTFEASIHESWKQFIS